MRVKAVERPSEIAVAHDVAELLGQSARDRELSVVPGGAPEGRVFGEEGVAFGEV